MQSLFYSVQTTLKHNKTKKTSNGNNRRKMKIDHAFVIGVDSDQRGYILSALADGEYNGVGFQFQTGFFGDFLSAVESDCFDFLVSDDFSRRHVGGDAVGIDDTQGTP